MAQNYALILRRTPTAEEKAAMWATWEPREYIIYRSDWVMDWMTEMKQRAVKCTCTACGESWHAGQWHGMKGRATLGFWNGEFGGAESDQITVCPCCGREVLAMHVGSFRNVLRTYQFRMTVGRLGEKLVLFGWRMENEVSKDGRVVRRIEPFEAYVVEQKRVIKLVGYHHVITQIKMDPEWYQLARCVDTWLDADELVGFTPDDLVGTTAENSKLDIYMRCGATHYPVSYLRLWLLHPRVENLLTVGCGSFVANEIGNCVQSSYGYYPREIMPKIPSLRGVNWKERSPYWMLGLDRVELRYMLAMKWSGMDLQIYHGLRAQGRVELPGDLERVRKERESQILLCLENGWPVLKMLRYIDKKEGRDLTTLTDYWKIASGLEWNLVDDSLRFPRDLTRQHDKVVAEKAKYDATEKAAQLAAGIKKRRSGFRKTAKMLERYSFEHDGILVYPCRTEEELIMEGEALSHCVSSYADDISKGKTSIFFIRRASSSDEPWYTVELDPTSLQILQNRGKCNCIPTAQVTAFVKAWKAAKLLKGKIEQKEVKIA